MKLSFSLPQNQNNCTDNLPKFHLFDFWYLSINKRGLDFQLPLINFSFMILFIYLFSISPTHIYVYIYVSNTESLEYNFFFVVVKWEILHEMDSTLLLHLFLSKLFLVKPIDLNIDIYILSYHVFFIFSFFFSKIWSLLGSNG